MPESRHLGALPWGRVTLETSVYETGCLRAAPPIMGRRANGIWAEERRCIEKGGLRHLLQFLRAFGRDRVSEFLQAWKAVDWGRWGEE